MEGFTVADGVALLIVAISALLAYSRGLVREVLAIVGWVLAAIAAFYFAPTVEPLIREIPYVRDVVESSCQLSILAAFVVVFAAALIVLSIFTPLFSAAIQDSALGPIDRGFGFIFGAARGILLIIIALLIYENVGLAVQEIDASRTVSLLADASTRMKQEIPTEMPAWVEVRYNQLLGNCGPGPTAPASPAEAAPAPQPATPPATTGP
jgi:membrane protein required for colicin V production